MEKGDAVHDKRAHTRGRWLILLDVVVSVALLLAAGVILQARFAPRSVRKAALEIPKDPVSLTGAVVRGSEAAPVIVLEFADFQCPFCSSFVRNTLPAIDESYVKPGRVSFAFRHFPLSIHPFAAKAAEAAECARQQGQFWEMHDQLYGDQQHLDLLGLSLAAQGIGLDRKRYDACLADQAAARVQQDAAEAKRLGVSSTPSFFLGTRDPDGRLRVRQSISGARPFKEFQVALDALLNK